jgi:hypothetical protein
MAETRLPILPSGHAFGKASCTARQTNDSRAAFSPTGRRDRVLSSAAPPAQSRAQAETEGGLTHQFIIILNNFEPGAPHPRRR